MNHFDPHGKSARMLIFHPLTPMNTRNRPGRIQDDPLYEAYLVIVGWAFSEPGCKVDYDKRLNGSGPAPAPRFKLVENMAQTRGARRRTLRALMRRAGLTVFQRRGIAG